MALTLKIFSQIEDKMADNIYYKGLSIWCNKGMYEVIGRYNATIPKLDDLDTMKANIELFWKKRYNK